MHDLFELALCLDLLIAKKYVTLQTLNESILHFPYKGVDETNKPHVIPGSFVAQKATKSWNLLLILRARYWQKYQQLFPHVKLQNTKHHYLEHYPEMIKLFGPLVLFWTMHFEAKHSFFKKVGRHTNCFRNIPLFTCSETPNHDFFS